MGVGRHDRSISPTRMGVGEKGHDEFVFFCGFAHRVTCGWNRVWFMMSDNNQ
jgi:hypothetical protein